jgi:hypothetical protein
MKILLDVESVLANTNEAVLQSTDKINREELLGEWDLSNETWEIYSGVSDAVWRHNPDSIPPEEPMLDRYTQQLAEGNTLDIVTGRQHVDKNIVWWLDSHNITYDSFRSYGEPKYNLGYDLYIDDNPELFGECRLLLRHQPWNADLPTTDAKSVDRIYSLADAVEFV